MSSKRVKYNDTMINEKTIKKLDEMLQKENILPRQKLSLFIRMNEYKKIAEVCKKNNEDLFKTKMELNSRNIMTPNESKENNENYCEKSKVISLNKEITSLKLKILELEGKLELSSLKSKKSEKSELDCDLDNKIKIYDKNENKLIIEELAELKSKALTEKNILEEKIEVLNVEIETLKEKIRSNLVEFNSNYELNKINYKKQKRINEELQNEIKSKAEKIKLFEKEIENYKNDNKKLENEKQKLTVDYENLKRINLNIAEEKDCLNKICEGYKLSVEEWKLVGKGLESNFIEEEMGKLLVDFDKILEETKSLTLKLEDSNRKLETLENELSTIKITLADCTTMNFNYENEISELKKETKDFSKEKAELNSKVETLTNKQKQLEGSIKEKEIYVDKYRKRLHGLSKDKEVLQKAYEAIKNKFKKINEELHSSTKTLVIIEAENKRLQNVCNLSDNGGNNLLIDLEKYRRLLRCSLCDSNFKNTALIKCMHCFCNDCIDERIRVRDRKCPCCNEPFSLADVKKIYL